MSLEAIASTVEFCRPDGDTLPDILLAAITHARSDDGTLAIITLGNGDQSVTFGAATLVT
jgi:hypothetical protein